MARSAGAPEVGSARAGSTLSCFEGSWWRSEQVDNICALHGLLYKLGTVMYRLAAPFQTYARRPAAYLSKDREPTIFGFGAAAFFRPYKSKVDLLATAPEPSPCSQADDGNCTGET